jgi:threonine dehydrogenase-like Zn-dependent dehydrogenase
MHALQFHGKENVEVVEMPRPDITDERDVVVRVSLCTLCGSDLHFYHQAIPETERGDVLGHEAIGNPSANYWEPFVFMITMDNK